MSMTDSFLYIYLYVLVTTMLVVTKYRRSRDARGTQRWVRERTCHENHGVAGVSPPRTTWGRAYKIA
jgi:hypothetical protein